MRGPKFAPRSRSRGWGIRTGSRSTPARGEPRKISQQACLRSPSRVVAALLSAHTQRNMASFAEAPAGDVAKGTSRHARTRGASTRALEGGRARPPARSPQLIPSVPILDVCFHRREDLQDQVRAVPRRRGRRRPQAGTSAATRAGTARMPTGDLPPPCDRPPIPRREKPPRRIARQRGFPVASPVRQSARSSPSHNGRRSRFFGSVRRAAR